MDIRREEGATELIPIRRSCRCSERLPGGDRLRKRVQEDEYGIDVADGVPCQSRDLPGPVSKTLECGIELLDLKTLTVLRQLESVIRGDLSRLTHFEKLSDELIVPNLDQDLKQLWKKTA